MKDLIEHMEKPIESIRKCLKQSVLKLNESKTEICLFSKKDVAPVSVLIGNTKIISSEYFYELRMTVGSKL